MILHLLCNNSRFRFSSVFYISIALLAIGTSSKTLSATIEFPEEELASESVLPVFDDPTVVRNKRIDQNGKLSLSIEGGLGLNDPFFSPFVVGGSAAYHFSSSLGAELFAALYTKTASQYVEPIKNARDCVQCPDFSYAPAIKRLTFLNLKWSPFYGKISFTKSFVMNLLTHFYAGAGMVTVEDENKPGLSLGLGQDYFLTKSLAIKWSLRTFTYNGPSAVSKRGLGIDRTTPSNGAFEQKIQTTLLLDLGLTFLL